MVLYICTKHHESISEGFTVVEQTYFPTKLFKGHDSVKIVGEVTILVLCTLPDGALYLFKKCLKRFKSYYTDTVFLLKFLKGHNSIKYVGGVKALLCTSPDYALYMDLYQF